LHIHWYIGMITVEAATAAIRNAYSSGSKLPIVVHCAPVLTLWASVVAEHLGHPAYTALTLGRAVAGSTARVKARNIGWHDGQTDHRTHTPHLVEVRLTAPVFLLGKTIRLLPDANGELRAALRTLPTRDGVVAGAYAPANPAEVGRYLARAFGDRLTEVRAPMEQLAVLYEPKELNRVGLWLYNRFRPNVTPATGGWYAKGAFAH
jgi:hypothetical protein